MKHLLTTLLFLALFIPTTLQAQVSTKSASGKLSMLRVHDIAVSFGGGNDVLDAEVIVKLQGDNLSYGFKLRKDANEISRQGMLHLLRDAYHNDYKLRLSYTIKAGSTKGTIIVVELSK